MASRRSLATPPSKACRPTAAIRLRWPGLPHQVAQCGWCQPGMLMSVAGAMDAGHHGSEIVGELGNVCVCGTYQRIKQAVVGL